MARFWVLGQSRWWCPQQTRPAARASGGGRGSTPAPPAKPLVGRLRGGSQHHLQGQAGGLGSGDHQGGGRQDIPDCHRQLQQLLQEVEKDWKHLVGSRCPGPQHNHRFLDPIREILMSIWRSSLRKIPRNLCKIANSYLRELSLRCAGLIFIPTDLFPGGVMFSENNAKFYVLPE